jgi:hypothetical protein
MISAVSIARGMNDADALRAELEQLADRGYVERRTRSVRQRSQDLRVPSH